MGDVHAKAALDTTPLHVAAHGGHLDSVSTLVGAGADPNSRQKYSIGDGHTVLHAAAERGHSDVVSALLRARSNPTVQNNQGVTPLQLAMQDGHTKTIQLLKRV